MVVFRGNRVEGGLDLPGRNTLRLCPKAEFVGLDTFRQIRDDQVEKLLLRLIEDAKVASPIHPGDGVNLVFRSCAECHVPEVTSSIGGRTFRLSQVKFNSTGWALARNRRLLG